MTYTISRNGQTYGPYTLDDLRRYVASGNVLPSDMAQAQGSADWTTVSQLLSGTPAAPAAAQAGFSSYVNPGYAQPYGAPAGMVPAEALQYPDAPNLHWGLVLLFSFLTCGLFMIVWNVIVTAWLRRVQPNAIALWLYVGVIVLSFLDVAAVIPATMHAATTGINHFNPITSFLGLAIWVVKLVARFSERSSLEEHFNGPEPLGLQLNPVMVFFFGGLYIQSQLNRLNELKQAARLSMGRGY